jgi:beta-lactamase regulating signal transducer with metallopeptidase domain
VFKIFVPEQLDVVLRHENAHQQSHDNMKRLVWLILPDALPFLSFFARLERAYKRLSEWAADDFAVGGEARRAMALAGALVAFARHQTQASGCTLIASFVEDKADLTRRVERLLAPRPQPTSRKYLVSTVMACATVLIAIATLCYVDLPNVHRLLESLSH